MINSDQYQQFFPELFLIGLFACEPSLIFSRSYFLHIPMVATSVKVFIRYLSKFKGYIGWNAAVLEWAT